MSLEGREQLEKLELEELSKSRGAASLFAASGEDTFPARRSREQFERYFIPALTVMLLALQAAAAFFPWQYAGTAPGVVAARAPLALALFGLLGLILFILGKYSSGLARLQQAAAAASGRGLFAVERLRLLDGGGDAGGGLFQFSQSGFLCGPRPLRRRRLDRAGNPGRDWCWRFTGCG